MNTIFSIYNLHGLIEMNTVFVYSLYGTTKKSTNLAIKNERIIKVRFEFDQ